MTRWLLSIAALFVLFGAAATSSFVPSASAANSPATPPQATRIDAAASSLAVAQQCAGAGRVNVTFYWQGTDPSALQLWIDLNTIDPNFGPGTFISAGPFAGYTNQYTWNGLIGSTTHFVRINQQLYYGAWDPGIFTFTTNNCGGGGYLPPAPGPVYGAPASIISLNCTSSVATASLNNVGPASTQNVGLNAYSGDTINCSASASGGQLTWRGPNGEVVGGTNFTTTVGGPKPANAPYDISVQLDWGGNPAIAHVSVTPMAPQIQQYPYPYQYPYSNPYPYPYPNPYPQPQPLPGGCFMTQYGTACY